MELGIAAAKAESAAQARTLADAKLAPLTRQVQEQTMLREAAEEALREAREAVCLLTVGEHHRFSHLMFPCAAGGESTGEDTS